MFSKREWRLLISSRDHPKLVSMWSRRKVSSIYSKLVSRINECLIVLAYVLWHGYLLIFFSKLDKSISTNDNSKSINGQIKPKWLRRKWWLSFYSNLVNRGPIEWMTKFCSLHTLTLESVIVVFTLDKLVNCRTICPPVKIVYRLEVENFQACFFYSEAAQDN